MQSNKPPLPPHGQWDAADGRTARTATATPSSRDPRSPCLGFGMLSLDCGCLQNWRREMDPLCAEGTPAAEEVLQANAYNSTCSRIELH
mmetsp:Transcript_41071/g.69015  ORF Transcript_41071/g.69015 Transcript_41071/m.69015 type:complete len:89 (+) Transcript_41071:124-390(+)